MNKPTITSKMNGVKGNKYKIYMVSVDKKRYFHLFKKNALIQFNAAMRIYKKKLKKKKK